MYLKRAGLAVITVDTNAAYLIKSKKRKQAAFFLILTSISLPPDLNEQMCFKQMDSI